MSTSKNARTSDFIHSVKGKILIMGILGITAAVVIGIVGVYSVNKNAQNSEIVSLVDEVNILEAQNLSNDALYQYYVDESYLNATLANLEEMEQKSTQLENSAGAEYKSSIASIISNVQNIKSNYNELLKIHNERGYEASKGKYQSFVESSAGLSESFSSLVNNNDWIEIHWIDSLFGVGGTSVNVDGKQYTKMMYHYALPEAGKRNSLIFRVGGTFTYKGDYYIKNIKLMNGSDAVAVDLSQIELAEMSGDGLESAEITDFGGEKAIKVTAKYDKDNQTWEEVSTAISVIDYDMEKYPDLEYELYIDPSIYTPGTEYKYGGAISGVYGFASHLEELDGLVATYSKLVVEGKDVTSNLAEIEALISDIETNIPKYTTDPSLAEASLALLAEKKLSLKN